MKDRLIVLDRRSENYQKRVQDTASQILGQYSEYVKCFTGDDASSAAEPVSYVNWAENKEAIYNGAGVVYFESDKDIFFLWVAIIFVDQATPGYDKAQKEGE